MRVQLREPIASAYGSLGARQILCAPQEIPIEAAQEWVALGLAVVFEDDSTPPPTKETVDVCPDSTPKPRRLARKRG